MSSKEQGGKMSIFKESRKIGLNLKYSHNYTCSLVKFPENTPPILDLEIVSTRATINQIGDVGEN